MSIPVHVRYATSLHHVLQPGRRGFISSRIVASGHNRWSKIKHDKGKEDAAKNKQRSSLAKELMQASKRT